MGNEASYEEEMCSSFYHEIKRLSKRFKKLDLDGSGTLSMEEFMGLPELWQNPLVQRVFDIFDTDGNGEMDFKEFILGTSQFSVKGDEEQKLRFAFSIYDMDKDGLHLQRRALPGTEDDGRGQSAGLAVTADLGQTHHHPGHQRQREDLLQGIQCRGGKPGDPQEAGGNRMSFFKSTTQQ
ncbi:hypothetical protein MC885_000474 [Smutsia gigantea]|nr:hypothetical protein MC885_000474 [Smutsia gigantea]